MKLITKLHWDCSLPGTTRHGKEQIAESELSPTLVCKHISANACTYAVRKLAAIAKRK